MYASHVKTIIIITCFIIVFVKINSTLLFTVLFYSNKNLYTLFINKQPVYVSVCISIAVPVNTHLEHGSLVFNVAKKTYVGPLNEVR